jgi:hypothetical protein
MTDLDKILNKVLAKNNSHWLNQEQIDHAISEGRLAITRRDVMDVVHIVLHGNLPEENELDNLSKILKSAIEKQNKKDEDGK